MINIKRQDEGQDGGQKITFTCTDERCGETWVLHVDRDFRPTASLYLNEEHRALIVSAAAIEPDGPRLQSAIKAAQMLRSAART